MDIVSSSCSFFTLEDPHFPYDREQVYPGDNFAYHLIPFEAAFAVGTAQMMPNNGMPIGVHVGDKALEEVVFDFNKDVITGLLRERYRAVVQKR